MFANYSTEEKLELRSYLWDQYQEAENQLIEDFYFTAYQELNDDLAKEGF